ncbi:glycerophosphodiester phosphodiesterase family protein [Belliella kenyensis]|uniref:Glycerophosphodiester phosphodiesterase family protein n=1 Tax=Belliella kenyensis TaxID=1472724 RepID=A0ABV8EQ40_9BACT|nr:glycerophosphodiester phosphodiesterase family protein [Belliella kenyensis]MCH7402235.1 family 16 glycosylhydrolase [Belliella kenyensis]MDN3601749.1 family 16 glycosylhydrolase [Belliella kenyensis]
MKILLFVFAVLCISCNHQAFQTQDDQELHTKIIAHRGAWKKNNLPQNSLASLRNAIEQGYDGSEFDVRITKDDTLIIVHDPIYQGLNVEESTYLELIELPLSNGERLPTLLEYLNEGMLDNPKTKLVLEVKPSENGTIKGQYIAEKSMALVKKIGAESKVIYISFDFEILKKLKSIDNTASVHYLEGDKNPKEVKQNKIDGINYHFSRYKKDTSYFSEAKELSLKLNSWTVNDPDVMDWLLDNNLDYITTDEPEILAEKIFLREKLKDKELVWQDEFDYDGLPDSTKWSFDIRGNDWSWGNNELQWYTDSNLKNAEVSNGTLKITAHKESIENKEYSSARLRSLGQGDFRYGYFEISAKLPTGNGTWPAIWMLPSNSEKRWPEGGEIDIMEHVGFNPDTVFATVHTKAHNHIINTQVGKDYLLPSAVSEFNVYSLYWDEEIIKAYVNGICYFTYEKNGQGTDVWPFDNEFHLLLNLAIGGGLGGKKGIDDSLFPHIFEVDYVRVYQ